MDRVKTLFENAVELPASERARFVAESCGDDLALRRRLEGLLAAHDEAGDFLEHPTGLVDAAVLAAREGVGTPNEAAGDRVDRFVLMTELGSGGFGTVWHARQEEPVTREVALKVLHARLDQPSLAEAFYAERQNLARMRHPSIAKVLDAGVADGRPWIAMELVDGAPIVRACEARALDLRARLGLFVEVCRALQHAHGKGIVHRDLKPSNVLLTDDAGRLRPVVIDFGISGSLDGRIGRPGVAGTPEYMSPEQAAEDDDAVDVRTDVHALGVLLYELVARARPFVRSSADEPATEILRRVREHEPAPPSRVRTAMPGVTGELDEIVGQALEKDPEARYPTANALGEDVQRYLQHRPIHAREGRPGYVLRKFVQRHRVAVFAVTVIVLTSLTAAVVATRGFLAARTAEQSARRALDVLDEVWLAADLSRFGSADYPVRELFADFERALPGLLPDEPAVEFRIRLSMARLQRAAGVFDRGLAHAERATELARGIEGTDSPLPAALLELGRIQYGRNEAAAAVATAVAGLAALGNRAAPGPRAEFEALRAEALLRSGDIEAAMAAGERAAALFEVTGDPAQRPNGELLLASLFGAIGQVDVALEHLRAAQAHFAAAGGSIGDELVARQHEAMLLARRGDHVAAEVAMRDCHERRRELFGPGHPLVASTASDLAWLLHELKRDAEAADLLVPAIDDLRTRLGERHLFVTEAMQRLGAVRVALDEPIAAEELLRAAMDRYRTLPAHPPDGLIGCMNNLAGLLWQRGDREQAADVTGRALALARAELPRTHFVLSVTLTNLAYMQQGLGRDEAAATLLGEALTLSEENGRAGEARIQRRRLVAMLRQLGRDAEADRVAGNGAEGR